MTDIGDHLESLRASHIRRKEHLKKSLAEIEEGLEAVDYLLELQERNEKLEEENHILRAQNDQLAAELRDAERG